MDDRMWNVFLQTGNVEAYLAVKQLQQGKLAEEENEGKTEIKSDVDH